MAQISDYRTGNTATYMGSNTPPRLFSDCHALDNSSYISPEYFIFSGTRHDPRSCTHTELVLRTIKGLRSKPSFWVSASSAQLTSIWADLARSSRAARDKDGWRGGDHQTLRVDNLVNAPKPPPPKDVYNRKRCWRLSWSWYVLQSAFHAHPLFTSNQSDIIVDDIRALRSVHCTK